MTRETKASSLRDERRLWHDQRRFQIPLGCPSCFACGACGGLAVEEPIFDCVSLCCGQPSTCTIPCPKNPNFADRLAEIDGLDLLKVPVAPSSSAHPSLPSVIPMFMHRGKRERAFVHSAVALSMFNLFRPGTPELRVQTREALSAAYLLGAGTDIVLSGTADDNPLERWWGLGSPGRREAARALATLKPLLVTTPNYSLFCDRVRFDDLHAMKRIAITAEELASAGLATAVHVNARTDRDYERWTAFLRNQPAIGFIAAEFATGAGRAERVLWHMSRLASLQEAVGRPLSLVMRGGAEILPLVRKRLHAVHYIETTSFMKAMKRQIAMPISDGTVRWVPKPTNKDQPVDDLIEHNCEVLSTSLSGNAISATRINR